MSDEASTRAVVDRYRARVDASSVTGAPSSYAALCAELGSPFVDLDFPPLPESLGFGGGARAAEEAAEARKEGAAEARAAVGQAVAQGGGWHPGCLSFRRPIAFMSRVKVFGASMSPRNVRQVSR